MAGIEKVCEVDGDSCGWAMYGWKRNSIQVKPEHRALFKGKKAVVFIQVSGKVFAFSNGGSMSIDKHDLNSRGALKKDLVYVPKGGRITDEIQFMVYVPEVQGQVRGMYFNYTYDWRATKHKLRKLLGLKSAAHLKIKKVPQFKDIWDEVHIEALINNLDLT